MSTNASTPPFRADHVGSLLRPQAVLDARARRARGEIAAEELREVEDAAIAKTVKQQEDVGLESITDGEFRRRMFHVDFLKNLQGVAVTGGMPVKFHNREGEREFSPPRLTVVGRIERSREIAVADFAYLRGLTTRTAKLCIPSPTMLHFRSGRRGISEEVYPDIEDFFADLARAYREEIAALGRAGCTYLQLDDTNLAYLCDPAMRERTRRIGENPDELPRLYARIINDSIRSRPPGMTVCIHLCRGNFQSSWVAEGGYEPVAEVLFNELDVDGYFLEYDDERSGDFSPLRFVPGGKRVVLGLVSSKVPRLERSEDLEKRIDEAARFVPLDQLALSPQCGFSSTVEGNMLSESDELTKLRLVVSTAAEVWR
ncbi:MAG: 5-methyltetrahydropteroyltriglutamate--homocysteine S-methyltransferase [Arenicellales bacterium]